MYSPTSHNPFQGLAKIITSIRCINVRSTSKILICKYSCLFDYYVDRLLRENEQCEDKAKCTLSKS